MGGNPPGYCSILPGDREAVNIIIKNQIPYIEKRRFDIFSPAG
jgi:hypothetical protein